MVLALGEQLGLYVFLFTPCSVRINALECFLQQAGIAWSISL